MKNRRNVSNKTVAILLALVLAIAAPWAAPLPG